ncbi:transcriptional regulator [Pantoea sp. YU22]|uniref:XRE family transcriptional regulator n=1 Tax=Pantoea sp. YU22 TaxID=2497684 RepID=UPI000F884A99|nr:XRE family transcriptional regulator [Pantoea sp. YU22]RTY53675.1 transcriptional regulator [Pantoea sp. YU22]
MPTKTLDELMQRFSPEQQEKIEEKAAEMRLELQLSKLRERLERTQQEQARAMNIAQSSVAAIEGRGAELKLSTLKRYVEALGGELIIGVNIPGGEQVNYTL